MRIRSLRAADLDQVLSVERAAYAHPWSRGIFEDCLRMAYPGWVVEGPEGRLLGHAILSLAVGEAHILNLCVHPDCQGRGVGLALLDRLLTHARGESAIRMFLEVRESNRAALKLYQARGFSAVGTRKAYYPRDGGREDAVVLRLDF